MLLPPHLQPIWLSSRMQLTSPLNSPLLQKAVNESFYVDDGLVGADSIEGAISLQRQLQELFARGGFTLRKWNCSNPAVL